ncbi:hypothetical protein CL617_01800 [archaeon]|nr:hypothetical protein [archaeon]|tara:strand:- start:16024 stop:16278 length:255 start_codon:yes stop_codon:yes gene_type:complete
MVRSIKLLEYLLAYDVMIESFEYEDKLKKPFEEKAGHPLLPTETDFYTALSIYTNRVKNGVKYPIVLASRITGLDFLIRKIEGK